MIRTIESGRKRKRTKQRDRGRESSERQTGRQAKREETDRRTDSILGNEEMPQAQSQYETTKDQSSLIRLTMWLGVTD